MERDSKRPNNTTNPKHRFKEVDTTKVTSKQPLTAAQRAGLDNHRFKKTPRDKKSLRRGRVGLVIAILLVVGLLGGIGYFFVNYVSFDGDQTESNDVAKDEINLAIEELVKSDEVIIAMDELIQSPLDEGSAAEIKALREKYPEAEEALSNAEEHISVAGSQPFLSDEEQNIIHDVRTSIQAREDLLRVGDSLLLVDQNVSVIGAHLENAQEYIHRADSSIEGATELGNQFSEQLNELAKETVETGEVPDEDKIPLNLVEESIELEEQALKFLEDAQSEIEDTKAIKKDLDFGSLEEYLTTKTQAINTLKEADSAILNDDYELASQKITSYNEVAAKATELADALPENFIEFLMDSYVEATEEDRTKYVEVRSKAAKADQQIRDYKGVSKQDYLIYEQELDESDLIGEPTSETSSNSEEMTQ